MLYATPALWVSAIVPCVFALQVFSIACQAGLPQMVGQPLLAGQPVAAAGAPPLEPVQQNAMTQAQLKNQLYERVLHKMRALMITKMAKPEVRQCTGHAKGRTAFLPAGRRFVVMAAPVCVCVLCSAEAVPHSAHA
jgi:hypothetical protein